jgi:hypothetical protein
MSKNCIDIVRPFVAELDGNTPPLQIVGGVGSYVLQQEGVEIRPDERLIIAPPGMKRDGIGQFRGDGNKRDFDVLVLSTAKAEKKVVEELAEDTIGKDLKLSVFGLHTVAQLRKQPGHSALNLARRWVSDRYVKDEGGLITEAWKALFPYAVRMDLDSLETWHTIIGSEKPIPCPHPGAVVMNYGTRSVSGLRPKDENKVHKLARNIFKAEPLILDWIIDGPGSSQVELARILHTAREPEPARELLIGGKLPILPYRVADLATHAAMMLEDPEEARDAAEITRFKASKLHWAESNERLVTLYQRYLEPAMGFITNN